MKNLFTTISDVHLNLKSLDVSLGVLRQALEESRKTKVDLLICGDLNDSKALMRSEWVKALMLLFYEFSDVKIHILIGNHDLNNKNSKDHSLEFLKPFSNVMIYSENSHVIINSVSFYFIPYKSTKEEFLTSIDEARSLGIKNLVTHQGYLSAFMGDYSQDESSVDPESLKDFEKILSGHYHKHQYVGDNIVYFGSPYTVNFGESKDKKYIWSVYESDGKVGLMPIPTIARRHLQESFESYIPEDFKSEAKENDLIKVILKGTKEFCLANHSKVLSKIFNGNTNITVVPEIISQSKKRIDLEKVSSPLQVIDDYLQGATTDFDKDILKNHLYSIIGESLKNISKNLKSDVKILSVSARNFLSFKELDYSYEPKGLTLIEGHDEDYSISTGAGKSSFLDVVCYGIFGDTSKKLKADEVINRSEGKNLCVKIELLTPKGKLLIVTYRKHKDFENDVFFTYDLSCSPENLTRGKDVNETRKLIEHEIGLDFDMFLRSTYFSQFGEIDRFLSSSDTEKKKIISQICNTEIYDEFVNEIKNSIKSLTKVIDGISSNKNSKEAEILIFTDSIKDLTKRLEDFEDNKKEKIKNIQLQIDNFISEINLKISENEEFLKTWDSQKQNELLQLDSERLDFESKRSLRIKAASANYNLFEERIIKANNDSQLLIQQKSNEIESLRPMIIDCITDFTNDYKKINEKKAIIKNLQTEQSRMKAEKSFIQNLMSEINQQIIKIKARTTEATCSYCYGPILGDAIQKKIDELVFDMNQKFNECNALDQKIAQIELSLSILPQLESNLLDIQNKEAEQNAMIKNSDNVKNRILSLTNEITKLQENLSVRESNPYTDQINQISSEVNPFDKQIELKNKEVNPFIQKIEMIKKEVNPYIQMLENEKSSVNPMIELLKNAEDGLKKHQTAYQEILENYEDNYNLLSMSEFWKDAIGIYIKSYLTDSFIEQINAMTNQTLLEMFDGILSFNMSSTTEDKKQTKEKIFVSIFNKNEECSYNSLSGGERCRICFALNLAVAFSTNKNLGFLMMDEILNGLDDVGKNQVMKILKSLEAKYPTIFVIDHATEFKAMFNNSILITKTNGISKIS